MTFPLLFFAGMATLLIWATARGKDAWPFSHYPMFSHCADLTEVEVFRVALETQDGEVIWWYSRFYRYPEQIGKALKKTYYLQPENTAYPFWPEIERKKLLWEVVQLMRLEEGNLGCYQALHIAQRTAVFDPHAGIVIQDKTVARITFDHIRGVIGGL